MLNSKLRICLVLSASLIATTPAVAKEKPKISQTQSDEEAFLIRRIAEFWKDGDFAIVKVQIKDFLEKYPHSELKDDFFGILGDIYLQENNYDIALSNYQKIKNPEIKEKILLNMLQCYYELDKYKELSQSGRPYLSNKSPEIQDRKEEFHFLMGEALFRQALQEEQVETKKQMAYEAQKYYETLSSGQYKEVSEFALAEISAIVGEHEKGTSIYRNLIEKHPLMKEDLLFQIATLEAKFNKLGAAETFRKVKDLNGARANEATFNLMVLLFQSEEYEEIIESYIKIAPTVPAEYVPTFNFIVGKSFFSLENYQNAVEPLQKYINSTFIPSDQLKNALLIQMTCAQQISNEPLFNETFEKLSMLFPKDSEIPKALFMHAMVLKEQGAISKADEKLKMIKESYPEFENQENFIFEYGLLAHQNERWQESYDAFKSYIKKYDESSRIDAAWKLFLSSAINLYKHGDEQGTYDKSAFFLDLQAVLYHPKFLSKTELKEYALLYAKIAYELDHYSNAVRCLQDHIFTILEEEDIDSLAEAHFIAGLCHAEMQLDDSAFCMHLEQAMHLNPSLYDSPSTHLQLYNAYISLAGYGKKKASPSDSDQKKEFIDQAAQHLEEAISNEGIEIKEENRIWLANYYYQKAKNFAQAHLTPQHESHPEMTHVVDRASSHYQGLLFSNDHLISINTENLYLENEVIKLAKLFEYQNANKQKLELIKALLEQQSRRPELNWTSKKDALYELGVAYETLGEKEKAFETFSFIHASANYFPSSIANRAALKGACLHFELLEKELRTEKNEEVIAILNDLKELQIRKNPTSEPTHLEAALEYAKIRSLISNPNEENARYLFFLNRIQDDFNSQEDLVTQDYHVTLNRNVEKRYIFDAYMKFIRAEKMRLQAKILYQQEKLGEMEEFHENALALYSELKNNPHTPYELSSRIASSIHEINALNAY